MILLEIASRLDDFDRSAIIFAERVDGVFTPKSQAVVLTLSEEERNLGIGKVATIRCPGLEYCLEIWLARDAIKIWFQWREEQVPSSEQAAEAICYKATFDAWGPPNF